MREARLVAPDGFEKNGLGELRVLTPTGLVGGKFSVDGYGLEISDSAGFTGSMLGVAEFDIRGTPATPGRFIAILSSGSNDRIHDNAVVTLSGNALFAPYGASDGTETFRKLNLDAHGRLGGLDNQRGVFTLTDGIDRGPNATSTLCLEGANSGGDEVLFPNLVCPRAHPRASCCPGRTPRAQTP
jgi:hypothetical protein